MNIAAARHCGRQPRCAAPRRWATVGGEQRLRRDAADGSRTEGDKPAGASRRILAVIESLITRRGLNIRLAPAIAQAFEGAELKGSDYASESKISKESGGRELRQAVQAGLLQVVRYPQGEAGFKASQTSARGLVRALHGVQRLVPSIRDDHSSASPSPDRRHGTICSPTSKLHPLLRLGVLPVQRS